ncbi:adenosylcobinamide-GDP ribazoletransferase [Geobacter sp. FeAm09]|uniref:adenosylcobinamide-GDP ribazoletransferase n=1 Tax=Geobacter sp. FeAm09 TaxID=2597769 RepID=UPI0011EE4337|nr:adenosylcobinamide-GDP ribazoletransferase [Geobacter sp. FeAm09]QEM69227.1 adenosylcobinamide-GDP ribazoletransferase [Geobacter sp. FeAm09]
MKPYLVAFQFLTIIPLPFKVDCEARDLGRSTALFPLVGLTIGALLAGLNWLLTPWLARPLVDALLITALAAVTGALHLDGLADVCDGIAARGGRERFLEVMKDSRVGAVGVVGIVFGLLLKWQALLAVPAGIKMPALLFFPALARCAQVLAMTGARHARKEGLGAVFIQGTGNGRLIAALALTLAAAFVLPPLTGLSAYIVVILLTVALRCYFQRRLDGLTGDVLGCISELAEITALAVIAVRFP